MDGISQGYIIDVTLSMAKEPKLKLASPAELLGWPDNVFGVLFFLMHLLTYLKTIKVSLYLMIKAWATI